MFLIFHQNFPIFKVTKKRNSQIVYTAHQYINQYLLAFINMYYHLSIIRLRYQKNCVYLNDEHE